MTDRKNWNTIAQDFLVGKTIKQARYLFKDEMDNCFGEDEWGASKVPLIIEFTDGSYIFPMSDDEGNDGGALGTSNEKEPTLPVIERSY